MGVVYLNGVDNLLCLVCCFVFGYIEYGDVGVDVVCFGVEFDFLFWCDVELVVVN